MLKLPYLYRAEERQVYGVNLESAYSFQTPFAVYFSALQAVSLLLVFCFYFFSPTTAAASPGKLSWQASLASHDALPPRLIAVDKAAQRLFLLEGKTRLRVAQTYICTTGQVVGDKLVEGDLKTPEGVYFVVRHIGSGLDYGLYGNEAYTLNFPNPVDKLRRKTGYGIWIHGRGERIQPLQTQGCVAMNNEDLAVLGKLLAPGTPVTLTETFTAVDGHLPEESKKAATLKKHVHDWAAAWSNRSGKFFDYYDKNSYSIAQGESFSAFQGQKERLFKMLPWIQTTVRDVQVLPGPGYWVTWFFQDYSAPNLSTKGVRRLYWQENAKGEFKIVGMEWIPGMSTSLLLASTEDSIPEELGRLEGGGQLISEEQATPLPGARGEASSAVAAATVQGAGAAGPEERFFSGVRESLDHVEDPRFGVMAEPPQAAELRASRLQKARPVAVASDGGLNLPPPLASQGLASAQETRESTSGPVVAVSPAQVSSPPPAAKPGAQQKIGGADAPAKIILAAANGAASQTEAAPVMSEPAKKATPPQEEGQKGSAVPTPVDEIPVPTGAEALAATAATLPVTGGEAAAKQDTQKERLAEVRNFVENWRSVWQAGNVDKYVTFYAPRAVQGARSGAESIRRHKVALWGRAAPAKVILKDIRIAFTEGNTATVTMLQEYSDAAGGGDIGIKTLTLRRVDSSWRITDETWSAQR